MVSSLFGLFLVFFAVSSASSSSKDRGFNSNIAWSNDLAAARAQTEKPVFLLIHKTWCGACKRLKSTFGEEKLEQRSRDFVMVNLEDDEEPADEAFKPDGGYIPRIFFLKGNTILPVTNEAGNPKYKYYYSSEDQILASMDTALKQFSASK